MTSGLWAQLHGRMVFRLAVAALLCLLSVVALAQTTVKYVHTDVLGSVVAMTDSAGNVVETRREYEPYGYQSVPAIQDGPGYTGHVQDAATGLTYMQQRYYDPVIGQFLSVDPVTVYSTADMRFFNRYAYVANNPYKFTDPDGRFFTPETVWDAANVVMGTVSAYDNFSAGNIGAGFVDVGGVLVDGAAAIIPGVPGGAGATIKAARGVDAVIDAASASRNGTRGASGELTTPSGNRYHGNSTGSSASGGDARAPMHPQMQQALDGVQNPSRTHGECCEVDAINKALNAGDQVRGSTMGPVNLNESGRTIPACSSCRVKKEFGVE